ncbi:hypothetical protein SKPV-WA-175 [Skunkpox virus]|uniref:Uncharacterized protein n=1 Tax=Skunkpox virus TaxID=160796 RepID=A0A1C9KBX2_9POXV|nr:hypothetical protein BIZ96_gp175 [Skunkpox virus]AOP31654.1 hypothetical protein SKPV-WA-175 [Skunkpox virus]
MVDSTHLLVTICVIMYISGIVAHIYLLHQIFPINGLYNNEEYIDNRMEKCCNLCPRICNNQLLKFL